MRMARRTLLWLAYNVVVAAVLLLSSVCHGLAVSRRNAVLLISATTTTATVGSSCSHKNAVAVAAETVGKDDDCTSPYCLGVWDGLLADCQDNNCVSSQDDTPRVFMEPWDYSESMSTTTSTTAPPPPPGSILERILAVLQSSSSSSAAQSLSLRRILSIGNRKAGETSRMMIRDPDRYLRVEFADGGLGEFYVTPNDTTVQFRLTTTTTNGGGTTFSNRQRAEAIRKRLQYQKLIVLRNRRRSLWFVESDVFDTFGPRSSALGPPPGIEEENSINRREEFNDPGREITQQFPIMSNGGQQSFFIPPILPTTTK
jgi:uncharacterized protein (DUF1499 family)